MNLLALRDLGPFGTDCYILYSDEKNAILIDAPYSDKIIINALESRGLDLKKILLTHGHCDHIEALNGLVKRFGCEVYIHENDLHMLSDRRACLAEYFGSEFEPFEGAKALHGGEIISLDGISLEVFHTPGHSMGSVCYIADDTVFSGDTLFDGSVGRTDLGGDFKALIGSIGRLIKRCGEMAVQPGHGEPTEVLHELRCNPYLGGLRG